MTMIFALFFLLLGFIGGLWVACKYTLEIMGDHSRNGTLFVGKYRITREDNA